MEADQRDELIDGYFQALGETDLDVFADVFAEDVQFTSFMVPEGLDGREAVLEYFSGTGTDVRPVENPSPEPKRRIHGPDRSVVEGVFALNRVDEGDDGGRDVTGRFCSVFEFGDGRVTAYRTYYQEL